MSGVKINKKIGLFSWPMPKHMLVAASAWGSRILMAALQFASIRVLMSGLGMEQYAIFALLIGLTGWFSLADMGIGVSLQNYISERRARGELYNDYIKTASGLVIILSVLLLILFYITSPYLSKGLLWQFGWLSLLEKNNLFFSAGILFIWAALGGISYKIWYAEQKGYFANIFPAIAALLGYLGIVIVNNFNFNNKLSISLIVFLAPNMFFAFGSLIYQVYFRSNKASSFDINIAKKLLIRAGQFWLFFLAGILVLQMDYVVISQFLKPADIVSYNVSTKIFGLVFFVYTSMLSALWPVFSEKIIEKKWDIVKINTKKYLIFGFIFIAINTIALAYFMPKIVEILSPKEIIHVEIKFIILLGLYFIIRVWTDTFAMILQSMNKLGPFWIYVPIQAVISVGLQCLLAPRFGLFGVVSGLILSFILTVAWGLPYAVKNHIKNFHK